MLSSTSVSNPCCLLLVDVSAHPAVKHVGYELFCNICFSSGLLKPSCKRLAFHIHQIPMVRGGRCPLALPVLCFEIPERQLWLGFPLGFLFQQRVLNWLSMLMRLGDTDLDCENHDCVTMLVSEETVQHRILDVFRSEIPCQATSAIFFWYFSIACEL